MNRRVTPDGAVHGPSRVAETLATARHGARTLAGWLDAFLYPQRCPGCGRPAEASRFLCEPCRAAVPRVSFPLCARCLARGEDAAGCARHLDRRVWPAWIYADAAAALVHGLKYAGRVDLARGLAPELARVVPGQPRFDLVVAVPLHPARRRERGYNQAALLAQALSEAIGVPFLEDALARTRATRPQARLGPEARRSNVAGAFAVRRPGLQGRNVMLVDDVITTGATFDACLGALARAGARGNGVALAWAQ